MVGRDFLTFRPEPEADALGDIQEIPHENEMVVRVANSCATRA